MTMSDPKIIDQVSAYIDGELPSEERVKVAELIATSNQYKQTYDSMKELSLSLTDTHSKLVLTAPDLWTELQAKLPTAKELVEEDLSAYLDGELLPPASDGIKEFLAANPDSYKKFQELSHLNQILAKALELPDSQEVDLWSTLKPRLEAELSVSLEDLSSYLDREVTQSLHLSITAKLLENQELRTNLARLSCSGEALRAHYKPNLSEDFDLWENIKTKLQVVPISSKMKKRRSLTSRRLYVAAAAVAGGVLATISFFVNFHPAKALRPVTAEAYLIESTLGEPTDIAEAIVYETP